jgi:uncharacterized protein involved in type VI secretion and phage assembly
VTGTADFAGRYFGVYPALVTKIVDDDPKLGRVEVKLPWLGTGGARDVRAWATMVSPYADDDEGLEILPAVGSQVVVAFEAGDLRRPYVLGATWNGAEKRPFKPNATNRRRVLKTPQGSTLEFYDEPGKARATLALASGHSVELDDSASEVRVTHKNGFSITLDAQGRIVVQANGTVEVYAAALNVHAATATFDGIINCTTINCSVGCLSPSYTPGAGNVW